MKKFIVILFLLFNFCNGQDLNFYSPFITNTYLNPSLAGHQGITKVSAAYQNTFPNLSSSMVAYFLNVEAKLFKNLGLSANIVSEDMGRGTFKSTEYMFILNYSFKLNEDFSIVPAFKFTQLDYRIDLTKLNFGDMINYRTDEIWFQQQPVSFTTQLFDYTFTGSLLLQNKHFNGGIVLNQFNEPFVGMLDYNYRLNRRFTFHSLIKLPIKEQQLNLFLRYDRQGKFNRMQLAAYLNLFKHYQFGLGYFNTDDLLFHFGYGNRYFAVNYNYLLTVSRLSGNTAGSHELGTAFYIMGKSKRKDFNKFLE